MPESLNDPAVKMLWGVTDETIQTDTLNVFNDGSVSDDIGTHGLISSGQAHALAGAGAATYFWIAGEDPDRYSRFLTVGAGPGGPSAAGGGRGPAGTPRRAWQGCLGRRRRAAAPD